MSDSRNGVPAAAEAYGFAQTREVAWGEMDALAHVNNTVYFRYFESARIAVFEAAGRVTRTGREGPILAETACRFRIPVEYPERLTVATRIASWGTTSVVMEHAVFMADGRLAAEGRAVVVWFDYALAEKRPWPEDLRAALEAACRPKA